MVAVNPTIFRAYDIRGVVDRDLSEAVAALAPAAAVVEHDVAAKPPRRCKNLLTLHPPLWAKLVYLFQSQSKSRFLIN